MQKHILLVDFDGVLYKNTLAGRYVGMRSSLFVEKVLRGVGSKYSRVAPEKSRYFEKINKKMYTSFGHTVIGLQKLGYDISVEDYNKFVFGGFPYGSLKDSSVAQRWKECEGVCKDMYVFSNSPTEYCNMIACTDLPNVRDLMSCTGKGNLLKPESGVYKAVSDVFPEHIIHFLDDSQINITGASKFPLWKGYLYDNDLPLDATYITCNA